ncbi:MAG TPA: hypothetical protein VF062_15495 [Candidatus Limnocylindrales bacterium]
MAGDATLTFRPRTSALILVRLAIGLLTLAAAGYRMTTVALQGRDRGVLVVMVWAIAIALSGVVLGALAERYPRLRPHAWTLLAAALVAAGIAELAIGESDPEGLVIVVACWGAFAAASWIGLDATTDLLIWYGQDLAHGPAVTFGASGVEYQAAHRQTPTFKVPWPEVREVALIPGPTGRPALCVLVDVQVPLESAGDRPKVLTKQRHRIRVFSTPIAVYPHRSRGPRLDTLDAALRRWTGGRLALVEG